MHQFSFRIRMLILLTASRNPCLWPTLCLWQEFLRVRTLHTLVQIRRISIRIEALGASGFLDCRQVSSRFAKVLLTLPAFLHTCFIVKAIQTFEMNSSWDHYKDSLAEEQLVAETNDEYSDKTSSDYLSGRNGARPSAGIQLLCKKTVPNWAVMVLFLLTISISFSLSVISNYMGSSFPNLAYCEL